MLVGKTMLYYPGLECDRGLMTEDDRVGCAAICVHQHQNGEVDLVVWDHDGNGILCVEVPVIFPPEYVPPFPTDEVDPPHRSPYCRLLA